MKDTYIKKIALKHLNVDSVSVEKDKCGDVFVYYNNDSSDKCLFFNTETFDYGFYDKDAELTKQFSQDTYVNRTANVLEQKLLNVIFEQ